MDKSSAVINQTKLRTGSALFLFATFFYGVFAVSAFSDDYPGLVDPWGIAMHATKDARPIQGFGLLLFFSVANSVQNLWILRLVGLIGLILLSDSINRRLLKAKGSGWIVFASTIAFTSISFQFFTHWAGAFMFPWVALLSLAGLTCWAKESKVSKMIGIVFLLLSLMTYPLLSFFVFSIGFVEWYFTDFNFSNYIAKLKSTILYIGTGSAVLFFSIALFRVFNPSVLNSRVDFVSYSEIPRKIVWFISRPVALGFRPYFLTSPTLSQLVLSALPILVLLLMFALRKTNFNLMDTGKLLLALAATIVFSLTPLLFVGQDQIDFRLVGAVKWLIETLLIGTLFEFLSTLFKKRRKAISGVLAGVLAFLALLNVNHVFETNFKTHYVQGISFFKKSLTKCNLAELQTGILIVSRTKAWPSRPLVGVLSQTTDLASEWVPVNSMKLYLSSQANENFQVNLESKIPKGFKGCIVRLDDFPYQ